VTERDFDDAVADMAELRARETEPPAAPTKADPLADILSAGRAVAPVADAPPRDDGLRSPDHWRVELSVPAWLHAMARQLHAWHEHEHHEGAPMRLSREAYIDALNAANETDPKRQGKPSLNAVSPHRGKGL